MTKNFEEEFSGEAKMIRSDQRERKRERTGRRMDENCSSELFNLR
jgi:hypothetical protein